MILICTGGDQTVTGMCGALTSTVIESSKTATGLLNWVVFPPLAYSPLYPWWVLSYAGQNTKKTQCKMKSVGQKDRES